MFGRTSLLKATALALPFSLAAAAAQAGDIAETVQQNQQLSTFAKAMETAKFDQQLSGAGPYTVFAPSDRAFEQLPPSALEELMKQENQAQLVKLLGHHVVQGQAIAADDVLGQQTQVDTLSGDTLTVDGTSQVVLLVPTGLTITRVGDQVVVEHQQEQQTAQTPTAEASGMPMTEHQQEALKSEPAQEQQQTAPQGTAMPATEHQRQVLAEQELPSEQKQSYEQLPVEGKSELLREATVVEPGIQADNGVIHVIDAVLVPQEVLKMLEAAKQGQG
jgi:transforming growth factor-beta-induced protein